MTKAHCTDAMTYFNLGVSSTMTNKKIEYFSKAIELNPMLTEAYEKRGVLYFFQEEYELMIEDLKRLMELDGPKAKDLRMLGIGYLKIGFYEEAVSRFTQAIDLEPGFAGAYSSRAEAYRFLGEYDRSIRDSTMAIRIGGDQLTLSDAYRNRYKTYWKLGLSDRAYADLRSSWRLDPRVWKIWRDSGSTFNYPEYSRKMGLIYLIGIAAGLIFKFKIKPPGKDE